MKNTEFKRTWCDYEIVIDTPKSLEVTNDDLNKESPPMRTISFALKTTKERANTKEIVMISCVAHDKVESDKPTPNPKSSFKSFSCVRKMDGIATPGLDQVGRGGYKPGITVFKSEKPMLEFFINKINIFDPDLIICHNLCGGIFDILVQRIDRLKISHWSRLGRFKRSQIPKLGKGDQ